MNEISSELRAKYGDRLAALSPSQIALLERALKEKTKASAPARKIPRRPEAEHYPLSVDQERLWFVQQFHLEYNVYNASRFHHPIEVPVLARAVDFVVARHEILRTTFPELDGRPVQKIAPRLEIGMPWVDLRGLPAARRMDETDRIGSETVRLPFDLSRLPLLRTLLIQVADADFIWPVTLHHIITDWIGFYLFEGELRATYAAFLAGEPSPVPAPALQYADFCIWQRARLKTRDLEEQVAYWQNLLRGMPETVPLPIDRPRPPVQRGVGGRQRLLLGAGTSQKLSGLAQRESTTPFVVLLAGFKALLARITGETRLIVSTPVNQRVEAETQNLLGFFLSQLLYCSDAAGNPSFRDMVRRERAASIEAHAHSEVPFSKLVEALNLPRDLSRTPFFQLQLQLFNIEQAMPGQGKADAGGVQEDAYWIDAQRTQSELAPLFWESPTGIHGFFEYDKAIFEAETIDRLKEQFRTLLAAAVDNPERRLWELPLLPEGQRHQLLYEWSGGAALPEEPEAGYLHAAFEAQAAARPGEPAIVWSEGGQEEVLTYDEVAGRAHALAVRLRRSGVGPEVAVVVAVDRSPEAVVALLGVLAAGGVYVPVDPETPAERAGFILCDTAAPVVVVNGELAWDLAAVHCLDLREESSWERERPARAPREGLLPSHLAYVIYTSGSTGEPKGVAVAHGMAASYFAETARLFGACPGERCLQFSSFAFDAALEQIFSTLYNGAALVVRGEEVWDPAELGAKLQELGVAVAYLPPSYWGRWVQSLPPGEPPAPPPLRLVTPGAEAMVESWVLRWQGSAYRDVALYNLYGPTETLVAATGHKMPLPYERRGLGGSVPIGRALPGRVAYVVDAAFNLLPAGVAGELVLGGPTMARGYLNRPELTAASFVPNPFAVPVPEVAGSRLYRTGDRVRLLPDGVIEFIGRIDFQVKVRGFRIELGEIEAALGAHPAVREVAVVARLVEEGVHRLVACFVAEGKPPTATALREVVRARLPEFMVPSAFVALPELPVLASGKVDRRALLERAEREAEEGGGDEAPRTPVEKVLVEIWREVLRRDKVGIHDNFFSLGGDSILSIQVIARAQRAGIQLAPRLLFQHQTIAELAEVAASVSAVSAEQGPVTGPVPLTPVSRWFFSSEPADPHHFNMSMLFATAVRFQPQTLAHTMAALESHHDALRLRFHHGVEGWKAENAPPAAASWPLLVVDLSAILAEKTASAAIEAAAQQTQASLDLEHGPIHRCLLFDLGAERPGRLFWTVHHLAVDGVSWRILLEDLPAAYAAIESSGVVGLGAKTTSFKEWAERLAAYAETPAVADELPWWQALPWSRAAPLPVDFPGGDNSRGAEETVSFALTAEETKELLEDVHRAFNTRINDLLLTALARAVAGWTGSPVVLVALEAHGREEVFPGVDLSRTVGWFTSVYPIVLDLSKTPDPGSAIKTVKEHLRSVPGNGLGFGLLSYPPMGYSGEPCLAGLPRAEMAFNYLGQLDQALPEDTPFLMARESAGSNYGSRAVRRHLLDWNGGVIGGCLQMTCAYSAGLHRRETVEELARAFADSLSELIVFCRDPEARGFTPSDFAGARLSQGDLDRLLGKLGKLGKGPGRK